jgi:hypothetical protein
MGGGQQSSSKSCYRGNPSYTLNNIAKIGNTIVVSVNQMPNHTHIGTIAEAGEHNHSFIIFKISGNSGSGGNCWIFSNYRKYWEMQVFILQYNYALL